MFTILCCSVVFLFFRFLEMRNEIKRLERKIDPRARCQTVKSQQRKWFYVIAVFFTLVMLSIWEVIGAWWPLGVIYIPIFLVLVVWAHRIEENEAAMTDALYDKNQGLPDHCSIPNCPGRHPSHA